MELFLNEKNPGIEFKEMNGLSELQYEQQIEQQLEQNGMIFWLTVPDNLPNFEHQVLENALKEDEITNDEIHEFENNQNEFQTFFREANYKHISCFIH